MAFNPDPASSSWRTLIEVALDGLTLRHARQDTALSDGTFYKGMLAGVSPLSRSAGQLLDPRAVAPDMRITYRNTDDEIRTNADSYEFANKDVTIKQGQGLTAGDYDTVFKGLVHFPGGITSWDDTTLVMEIDDVRDRDSRGLPVDKIFSSDYPNVEQKSEYVPKPLVYGDWRTTAGNGETVPCLCVDTTAGTGGQFMIADHALKEIEVVYKNGVDITSNCTLDAANGMFTISSTTTYDPTTDVITANVQGATDDGTTSGSLLQTIPAIFDDILQTWLSVDSADIDATAISNWESELSTSDYVRRWIGQDISSDEVIRDLLVEGFADLKVTEGKYTPTYRQVDPSVSASTFRDFNIRNRGDGQKDFSVERDPERVYLNEIVAEYCEAPQLPSNDIPETGNVPASSVFTKSYTNSSSSAITNVGARKRRRMKYRWLYLDAGAQARANRELYTFSTEIEMVNIVLDPRAMTLEPTDQFYLAYSKYADGTDGTAFQVRDTSIDFERMTVTLRAWNVARLTPGRWTAAAAPNWSAATLYERQTQGFWTTAGGLADAGDPNSGGSIWF